MTPNEFHSHQYHITSPTHFYSDIRFVSIMPTLRIVYLTEQQYYAGMTDHARAAEQTSQPQNSPLLIRSKLDYRLLMQQETPPYREMPHHHQYI